VADRARHARGSRRGLSQNFLRGRRLASDIVRGLDVEPHELIVEIGAGDGRLTAELARRARRVVAIEVDPRLAASLRPRFDVVEGDALTVPMPDEPFRIVGNIPFHLTTAILRRLLDELDVPLRRADLIVQWNVARKRAAVVPTTQLAAEWGPWWELVVVRRLDASAFEPRPNVDAALLRIVRRPHELLPAEAASEYRAFVRRAFRSGLRTVVPRLAFKRGAAAAGFARGAHARDLDVHQWAALFRASSSERAARVTDADPLSPVQRGRKGAE
jgi:23S rRNA (adenine-N6)-dimethyltransferase